MIIEDWMYVLALACVAAYSGYTRYVLDQVQIKLAKISKGLEEIQQDVGEWSNAAQAFVDRAQEFMDDPEE